MQPVVEKADDTSHFVYHSQDNEQDYVSWVSRPVSKSKVIITRYNAAEYTKNVVLNFAWCIYDIVHQIVNVAYHENLRAFSAIFGTSFAAHSFDR